jgi:hypothetical protein
LEASARRISSSAGAGSAARMGSRRLRIAGVRRFAGDGSTEG